MACLVVFWRSWCTGERDEDPGLSPFGCSPWTRIRRLNSISR
jgi:hypothetical protein